MKTNNIEKERIILKVFVTKEDIKYLTGNSNHQKAIEIFNLANDINTGYKDSKYVNVANVLKVLGVKASDIMRNANIERNFNEIVM